MKLLIINQSGEEIPASVTKFFEAFAEIVAESGTPEQAIHAITSVIFSLSDVVSANTDEPCDFIEDYCKFLTSMNEERKAEAANATSN